MTTTPSVAVRPSSGRLLLALGIGLAALGIVAYAVQIAVHRLTTPWYVPIAATLGFLLALVALWQRRSGWRIVAVLLVGLLASAEWAALFSMRLPAYEGPVSAGQSFPDFVTKKADGTTFAQTDLQGGPNNVLVFFRGRW